MWSKEGVSDDKRYIDSQTEVASFAFLSWSEY